MGSDDPQPIPRPADFPVEWNSPEDEKRFWTRNRMHSPFPLPMFAADILDLNFGVGMNKAHEHFGRPIRMVRQRINGYSYTSVRMAVPPAEIAETGRRAHFCGGRLRRRWSCLATRFVCR